jgi:hypothetical protein
MRKLSLTATAFFCIISSSALANGLDFSLINATGYDIRAVFVDANSSSVWTDDIMGADILADGGAVDISFAPGQDTCMWDLKVEWTEEYEATVWYELNLCDISEVTLEYNRETNETIAFTK